MNVEIQGQFDRLESALDSLINSITNYSPSTNAASSVIDADDELSRGLERLTTHQRNYHYLQQLRATSEALDNRIKTTLSTLAETRSDIIKRTLTCLPSSGQNLNPVGSDELLDFAQQIARSTVPPTERAGLPPVMKPIIADDESRGKPVPQLIGQSSINAGTESPAGVGQKLVESGTSKAFAMLPSELKAWLEPESLTKPFTPWPSDEAMKRGALMRIEAAWEVKGDPVDRDLVAEADAELERIRLEAEESKQDVVP